MNKNFKKLMIAGLVCGALCGTALAAPHGGHGGRGPARAAMTHMRAMPARHCAPAHHTPPPPVVHHTPPPPPPPPVVHHECGGLALIGALVGGIIGAVL